MGASLASWDTLKHVPEGLPLRWGFTIPARCVGLYPVAGDGGFVDFDAEAGGVGHL
jgi:hypothetical protein